MPRPSDYTLPRRRMLHVVMATILAGTLGLAALVGSMNRRFSRVELIEKPVRFDDISIRLPVGWTNVDDREDARTLATAMEDGPSPQRARRLTIMCEALAAPMSPIQYLVERLGVPVKDGSEGEIAELEAVTIAGQPGAIISISSLRIGNDAPAVRVPQKDVYAAAVLPSRRAVVVHLRGIGESDQGDEMVVRKVAGALAIGSEPAVPAVAQSEISLRGGTNFAVPPGLLCVEPNDPLRADRLLWPVLGADDDVGQLEARWLTVEVIECLFIAPAAEAGNERDVANAAFETLLLSRDATWRGAAITPAGQGAWRAEPRSPAGGSWALASRQAYLLADPGGRALLAIFRGGVGGRSDIGSIWKSLAGSVKFGASPDIRTLETRGAAVASAMAGIGYEKLVSDRTEQWWLWTDARDRPHRGWSHVDFDVAAGIGELRGEIARRIRQGNEVTRLNGRFRSSDAAADYHSSVTRAAAQPAESAPVEQTIALRDQRLGLALGPPGNVRPEWEIAMPQQFVPGALLPLLMDQFHRDPGEGELIVRSEEFMGVEAAGPPQPLTILIRSVENVGRLAEGETEPMRCVEAEVNGSGMLSRWYFRKDGAVECVDLPGGLQRTRSDFNTVKFAFDQDPRMALP